jgi:hypothetical protein
MRKEQRTAVQVAQQTNKGTATDTLDAKDYFFFYFNFTFQIEI